MSKNTTQKWYCIYRITNLVNGKTYIGQHLYKDEIDPMQGYYGSGIAITAAINKYGKENFTKEVLYRRIRDRGTADAMEIFAISRYKPEYNISKGGQGGNLTMFWTKEGRQKCINTIRSPEVRAKANASQKGKKHSNVGILKAWNEVSTEQRQRRVQSIRESHKRYWESLSPEEKAEKINRMIEARRHK